MIAVGGESVVIPDEFFANYNMSAQQNAVSPVGFEKYRLLSGGKIDQATAIKIFNEYTAKELSLYMNALAKNPTPEALRSSLASRACGATIIFRRQTADEAGRPS